MCKLEKTCTLYFTSSEDAVFACCLLLLLLSFFSPSCFLLNFTKNGLLYVTIISYLPYTVNLIIYSTVIFLFAFHKWNFPLLPTVSRFQCSDGYRRIFSFTESAGNSFFLSFHTYKKSEKRFFALFALICLLHLRYDGKKFAAHCRSIPTL